jgi:alpha-beta hydrolase superfamily lysophospholipase
MRYGTRRTLPLGVMLLAAWLPGCFLPLPDEILANLSYAILIPERTCEQMRDDFELDDYQVVADPSGLGLAFEETFVPTSRGATVRVWYIPAEAPRGVVVVSPGAVATIPCYLFTVVLVTELGYDAVIYDYEGFGGSTGEAHLESLLPDLAAVVDWTRQRTGQPQVVLFGMSLGSIPSVALAAAQPEAVAGLVLDSPVALAQELARFDALLRGQSEWVIRVLEPDLIAEQRIGDVTAPLLVFGHEADLITPARHVQLLYDRAAGPKELVIFAELGHAQGQFLATDQYQAHLAAFLDRVSPAE